MKKVFALFATVLVVMACVLPAFAEGWDANTDYQIALVNPPRAGGFRSNTGDVMYAVNGAEELGLFGGMKPVAILYSAWEDGMYVCAVVPSGNGASMGSVNGKETTFAPFIIANGKLQIANLITYTPQAYTVYYLAYGGDWFVGDYYPAGEYLQLRSYSESLQSQTAGYTAVVFRDLEGNWVQPDNASYTTGWGTGNPSNPAEQLNGVREIGENYQEHLYGSDSVAYQLDIPAIFDGMFNGVKDILGAFDIEIFGINIVSTLIAIVVIAIVAFIVRKLVK